MADMTKAGGDKPEDQERRDLLTAIRGRLIDLSEKMRHHQSSMSVPCSSVRLQRTSKAQRQTGGAPMISLAFSSASWGQHRPLLPSTTSTSLSQAFTGVGAHVLPVNQRGPGSGSRMPKVKALCHTFSNAHGALKSITAPSNIGLDTFSEHPLQATGGRTR
ncbi:hypothetical protein LB505_008404 [Fusarium chuoi]|nr:hypothetical protein LB505_008404 [Fusarium chuoi]